jgi:thymidylate kinase
MNGAKYKSNIIFIEGSRGVGKSSIVHYLRQQLRYTNSANLTGNMYPNDESKTVNMYKSWVNHLKTIFGDGISFVFDRFLFTEIALCRMGYKQYDFEKSYECFKELMFGSGGIADLYNVYYVTLTCDAQTFGKRLQREKIANNNYDPYEIDNCIRVQEKFIKIHEEIQNNYKHVHTLMIDSSNMGVEEIGQKIKGIMAHNYD